MKSWNAPEVPALATSSDTPTIFCTAARGPIRGKLKGDVAKMYVCGITPYDATHLGHASTYVAFDILNRVWRDAGYTVNYVQNITDIDDPLLERAQATGVDWQELAHSQIELFRSDMEALRVIPPEHYIGAVESMQLVVDAVTKLLHDGFAYTLDNGDVYYRVDKKIKPRFGSESHLDRDTMLKLFAERGGDPDTPGKENPLDPLLWRAARPDEPSWPGGELGDGRPGWHIECTVIANEYAGLPLDVQGGGSDLVFPHHEMGAAHAVALTGQPLAKSYIHSGMVGYEGQKMSKSLGNLVLVSELIKQGVDPMAIRLAILDHHYRNDWMFDEDVLKRAQIRLDEWRRAAAVGSHLVAKEVIQDLRGALADDLDTPVALGIIDDWAAARDSHAPASANNAVVAAVDALLGVKLIDHDA